MKNVYLIFTLLLGVSCEERDYVSFTEGDCTFRYEKDSFSSRDYAVITSNGCPGFPDVSISLRQEEMHELLDFVLSEGDNRTSFIEGILLLPVFASMDAHQRQEAMAVLNRIFDELADHTHAHEEEYHHGPCHETGTDGDCYHPMDDHHHHHHEHGPGI